MLIDRGHLAAVLRQMLSDHIEPPPNNSDLLEIDSFTLVTLAEEIEERFGFQVAAKDMAPENFGTLDQLADYVERQGK